MPTLIVLGLAVLFVLYRVISLHSLRKKDEDLEKIDAEFAAHLEPGENAHG